MECNAVIEEKFTLVYLTGIRKLSVNLRAF